MSKYRQYRHQFDKNSNKLAKSANDLFMFNDTNIISMKNQAFPKIQILLIKVHEFYKDRVCKICLMAGK